MAKIKLPPQNDAEKVVGYIQQLQHPLKAELEVLRTIIKNSDSRLTERIKWNAPSYFIQDDLLTFNLHLAKQIRLVLHHPTVVKIQSAILEGNYADRRLIYFSSMEEIEQKKTELERILKEYIALTNEI
jgi:uncharacterized protein YdhG (YjbR/CyaY superfamily)